jgi:transposase-like protein
MGETANIRQIPTAARTRILLICPDCGAENAEYADRLRGMSSYACAGDECGYRFDLLNGARKNLLQGFAEAMRRFYAALIPAS